MEKVTYFRSRGAAMLLAILLAISGFQVFEASTPQKVLAATGDPGSISFGNTSKTNYLTYAKTDAFAFGTADFTIEFWWKPTVGGRNDVFDLKNQTLGETAITRMDLGYSIGGGGLKLYTDGGCAIDSGKSLVLNKWMHIALTRSSNTFNLWLDGVQKGTTACAANLGTAGYALQLLYENGGGNLANIRVVKGTALYTSTFAPSTAPPAKVAGTSLLLTTSQGADFLKDSSDNALVPVVSGSPASSSSVPAFGSVCFDNASTPSYVELSGATNAVGLGDFTLEAWIKIPSSPGLMTFVNGHAAITGVSVLSLYTNGVPGGGNGHMDGNGLIQTKWGNLPASTWAHVAYVRQNQSARMFLNGVPSTNASGSQTAAVADTKNYTSNSFRLGYANSGAWPAGWFGCMAEVTLTNSALYSSDFSASLPYPKSRSVPSSASIFLKSTPDGLINAGSGATPTATGSVTYSSDLPSAPLTIASATISGTSSYGQQLSAAAGVVSNAISPTTSYQWLRAGVAISGATNSSYLVTSGDVGRVISVTVTVSSGGNSASATSPGTVTVTKATPTFTWPPLAKTYGDASFAVAAPTSSTAGTFTYTSSAPSVVSLNGGTATVVGAGISTLTATFTPTDTTNYVSGVTAITAITVEKASLSITASSHTVSFGDGRPTITPSFSGFVNGDSESVISNLLCSTAYSSSTSVGAIATNCSGATALNYSFVYTAGVITVGQGVQSSGLSITSTTTTYGTPLYLITSGGSGSGANSFFVDSGPCSVSGSTLTATAAGTCMVTATKAASGNFLAASSGSTAITIDRKSLTITGLTGVNKEFDHGLTGSVTGTPTLSGVVGLDDVLLDGTPAFAFADGDVGNGKTVIGSGFTLTGNTAGNYTLSQPAVTANITKKAARVIATDRTVAFGAAVAGAYTTSGLLGGDVVASTAYTFSGTGTSTAPTAVGAYSITPSNSVFGSGSIGNYDITYVPATLTILAKYTTTYNSNGGLVANGATSSVDFVVGDTALTLPSATRANFTFVGWFTQQTNGIEIRGGYTPISNATLWARWVQNSLYGIGSNTKILTITTLAGVGNTYSASAGGGTIAIEYLADALPAGTVIDAYVLADTTNAATVIGAGNNYVMSLVLAWLAPDGTVPTTATGKAISMTITNATIKRGAKIYSVIGSNSTLLGTATVDGSATVPITDDPQIFIAITRPDAPTGILATSGVNAGSTITWSAPVSDGGAEITGYTVTSNTGETCISVTTACSMTGLTNGVAYTFTVTATNAIGNSTTSTASLTATPAAPIISTPTSSPPDTSAVDEARAAEAKALAEAKARALAEAKALAEDKAAAELKAAAEAQATADAKAAADVAKANALAGKPKTPSVSLYLLKASLKLSAYDTAYLKKYVSTLESATSVTCSGYVYPSKESKAKSKALAVSQATALCKTIKSYKPSLKTAIVTFDSKLAPKAAKGSKWVGVSYRVDGRTGF
jgi:hypothetical protein